MFDHNDPWTALRTWLDEAVPTEPRVPEAMQIATVGADGRPSLRTVLLKSADAEGGIVFFTNYNSRKARELAGNANIAALLHFKGLERQVVVEGTANKVSPEASAAYFASRPRGSQLGAWASQQSEPVASRQAMNEAMREVMTRFEGVDVPCPPHWGGYRIDPVRFEFWQGYPDRFHHRVAFIRDGDGWNQGLLQP